MPDRTSSPDPLGCDAGYRLDVAHEQLLTGLWVFWLVHLRLESGEDSWFEYVKLNIRPR
jgi:hypothetical protein